MQTTLLDLLRVDHMLVDVPATDAFSAIRLVNAALVQSGHTLEAFGEDACARETTFPTGLPTQPIAVAIPHADPPHVLATAVAIGVLRSPVQFSQMGTDGSVHLDVHAVFLLAVKDQAKQVEMIQQLMKVIQNQSLLGAITRLDSPGEMHELIRKTLTS